MIIANQEKDIEAILNDTGYEIYFKNLKFEEEIIREFPPLAGNTIVSRLGLAGSSTGPVELYLNTVVETVEFLNRVSNQESKNSTFLDVIKSMDVSKPLSYMFGEGLEIEIKNLEAEYNSVLELIQNAFPGIDFSKRYPFSEHMRKFSRLYLSQSLRPIAEVMTTHQKQLKKALVLYKKNMKNRKELQSAYFISKLAGSFLGGISGSLAVSALFNGMNSFGEQQFSRELSHAYQTWNLVQSANLTETIVSNFKPRLHHLYLSLVGGLLLNIQKDLKIIGFEIYEFNFVADSICIELHDQGEKAFTKKMEYLIRTCKDVSEIINAIKTFEFFPQLISSSDTSNNLYIEKLYVQYMYLQAESLLKTGKAASSNVKLMGVTWLTERIDEPFSFLDSNEYYDTKKKIEDAFNDFPNEMQQLFKDMIEVNKLYSYCNQNKSKKILDRDFFSELYIKSCIYSLQIPDYDIEEMRDFAENSLSLMSISDTAAINGVIEKWISKEHKKNPLRKWINKFQEASKLEEAILSLDYRSIEKLASSGIKVRSLLITREMVSQDRRHLLKLIATLGKPTKINVEEEALLFVIKNQDDITLEILLELGIDPFTALNDTYLLANITTGGNFCMIETIYQHCLSSMDNYILSIQNLPIDKLTPYYYLYITGNTYWPEQYPELINSISVERRERELTLATSSLSSLLLSDMFKAGYDSQFISFASANEESFLKTLCSTAHYVVFNEIYNLDSSLLVSRVGEVTMLREVYELGNMDMAWHLREALGVYDIGEVNYEDVEEAALVELNENFLTLLKQTVEGVPEALGNIRREAHKNGQIIVMELIDRVLKV